MSDYIVTDVIDGIGRITLNRPAAINALDESMMHTMTETLVKWSNDDDVTAVELSGNGDRGFCSGADVRALSQALTSGGAWLHFLEHEYSLDMLIADYPKPVTSHLRGIAMGGGLGIGAHADRRIVYADTVMAMPETKIGFFPDVGIMYQLSRAGAVGRHVTLTSATFTGGDALLMNLADESADGPLPAPLFDTASAWIEECYVSDQPAEIVAALENHPDENARKAAAEMRLRSPLSVHVALRALNRAKTLNLGAIFDQDLRLAERLLPKGDFVEGVRALLVDKDNQPTWLYPSIEEVPLEVVDEIFAYRSSWKS